jgi:hypothetical protein
MERYPEHTFTCSTAQQVKWLEEFYPSLFEVVKGKVKDGRFHMVGGSWVENDTNMPSGTCSPSFPYNASSCPETERFVVSRGGSSPSIPVRSTSFQVSLWRLLQGRMVARHVRVWGPGVSIPGSPPPQNGEN